VNQPSGGFRGLSSTLRGGSVPRLKVARASAICMLAATLGLCAAAPASAEVVHEGVLPAVGLQPRTANVLRDGNTLEAITFSNKSKNPVVHSATVYAIYWDPEGFYHGDWQALINSFLKNLATTSSAQPTATVLGVDALYSDASGRPAARSIVYGGAYVDSNPYPASECVDPAPLALAGELFVPGLGPEKCFSDAQLRAQLGAFVKEHALPTGLEHIYVLLTPPGVTVCLDAGGASGRCSDYYRGSEAEVKAQTGGKQNLVPKIEEEEKLVGEGKETESERLHSYRNSFCSYHSYLEAGGSPVLYAVVPWTAGGTGDYHLPERDQMQAYDCQMGNFNPANTEKVEAAEKSGADQEPNQEGLSPDGAYDHGLADIIVTQIGSELQNTITNPLLNAWQGSAGGELTDQCRNFFAGAAGQYAASNQQTEAGTVANQALGARRYALNDGFDLAALKVPYPGVPCLTSVSTAASFVAPAVANVGEAVAFDGDSSLMSLDWSGYSLGEVGSFPEFSWSFGDGSPVVKGFGPPSPECEVPLQPHCADSVFHTFTAAGVYFVTLTIKDRGGNESSITEEIKIEGPPSTTSTGGGTGSTTTTTTTTTSKAGAGSGSSSTLPAPSAHAAAVSGSLRAALRHGLEIRYEVSEQVAGEVQVLMNAKLAHRLHIRGRRALGLPKGQPSEIVIGRALVVTRKGGSGRVRVRFNRTVIRALRRLQRVRLMLHMVVRDAERAHPKTAAVTGVVVLKSGTAAGSSRRKS